MTGVSVAATADVEPGTRIGDGTAVWHLAVVRSGAVVGQECVIGRGAYLGPGVRVGDRVKIQNHALVYEPAVLEDDVFVGPAAVLSNDRYPRAATPDGAVKRVGDWSPRPVVVRQGAAVGANAVCVAGVTIGRWALVGAGAVVVRDVEEFALVVGNPARRVGWVGRAGVRLVRDGTGAWRCPVTGERYDLPEGG